VEKVAEQKLYQAPADWLDSAVATLRQAGVQVFAPTAGRDGDVDLAPAASGNGAVARDYVNTHLPLKRLFFPETEVLLEYERKGDGDVDVRPADRSARAEAVLIGCRPCDAAALAVLDEVFQWDYEDMPYASRRERATVVAFACTAPDEHCFCTSVGGSPQDARGSDVLVLPGKDGGVLMQVNTPKGQAFVERLGLNAAPADAKPAEAPRVKTRFEPEKIKAWLDGNFSSPYWDEVALRCLGCGACSYLCPTCHCFDIVDEATWNGGERRRNWDCCSFGIFTKHASGHNPRADQSARCRQRVMHKFKYFPERFGTVACVGCGRCVRACGVGQGLPTVLAGIPTEQPAEKQS
jgi:formate hydrogenlyase subunit 6/NADH:ubiquinone oxidoreductase subunit I